MFSCRPTVARARRRTKHLSASGSPLHANCQGVKSGRNAFYFIPSHARRKRAVLEPDISPMDFLAVTPFSSAIDSLRRARIGLFRKIMRHKFEINFLRAKKLPQKVVALATTLSI
jgi:hypothetical protein